MKVILLQDIRGVGKKHDVKDVSLGYARNFLLPKSLAEVATPPAFKKLMDMKAVEQEEKKKLAAVLEEKAREIKKLTLNFELKTGGKGEVFGSVTAKDIEEALADKGISGVKTELSRPIKELGEKEVEVGLGEGIKTKVKVVVE
ncbi:MAG: 50S ribosomal protein L9 [Candidatus Brennerbacteria bacterium]|nr:50S ribosomal protein L9 [Candidatus Brennerbacteria bacterium]